MAAATLSGPIRAGQPSAGVVLNAGATDLIVISHPANFVFSWQGAAWSYTYNGQLPAGTEISVAAHKRIQQLSTTIALSQDLSGLQPVSNALFVSTGDSKGEEGLDSLYRAIIDGNYDADWRGLSGNPGGSGRGGSQSGPINAGREDAGLTEPGRMAIEKAAIAGYVAQERIVYSNLRMFTNDFYPFATTIANLTKWHNDVSRAGGARGLLLWGSEPSTNDTTRNAYLVQQNAALKQYALDNAADTVFVDVYNFLLRKDGSGLGDQQYFRDGIHKNEAGEVAVAPLLYPALDILCTKKGA